MKAYLRNKYKLRSLPELKEGIRAYWSKLTPELCSRYINTCKRSCSLLKKRDTLQDTELSYSMEEQLIVCGNVIVIVVTCVTSDGFRTELATLRG